MTGKRFENRLDKSNMKFNTLNPVWDNGKEDALNVFKMIDLLNEFDSENKKLEKENLDLSEELDYLKTKCASLETGLFQADRETEQLRKENKELQGKASSWKITASEQIMEQSKLIKENEQLKKEIEKLSYANEDLLEEKRIWKQMSDEYAKLSDENEQLKQELFESEKEWYECHYADNPVRLDSKLEALKEEFKERFGRDFE